MKLMEMFLCVHLKRIKGLLLVTVLLFLNQSKLQAGYVADASQIKNAAQFRNDFVRIRLQSQVGQVVATNNLSLFSVRGGSEEDDYDSEDDDDDLDLDDKDILLQTTSEVDDFSEGNLGGRILELWSSTPPFTKAYLSASMMATAMGYFFSKNHEFPSILLLEWKPLLRRLQLWRLVTAFLNFGPFGFGYVMTGHFVWTYMSTLERLHHDKPYDFWLMIAFGGVTMVAGYTLLGISPRYLGHNLSTFLVYIWSRYHEGMEVNIMELFNTRAETLPWFFLAQVGLSYLILFCLFSATSVPFNLHHHHYFIFSFFYSLFENFNRLPFTQLTSRIDCTS
jgi:Derlin-2/3